MARTTPAHATGSPRQLAVGLLDSVISLWALCAKHATRVSRKLRVESMSASSRLASRPPLTPPKRLLATLSNKAIHFRHRKPSSAADRNFEIDAGKDFSDSGLWQRNILMGDKCQPLDFSGVIYYDSKGNQLPELPPRSPRASPLPSYVFSAARREERHDRTGEEDTIELERRRRTGRTLTNWNRGHPDLERRQRLGKKTRSREIEGDRLRKTTPTIGKDDFGVQST
ncbi:hypothetical protein U1Q18_005072, partial [Sarracenia purpurea var. burkii]